MKVLAIILATIVLASPAVSVAAEQFGHDHVVVSYAGISRAYAEAIGRTVAAARKVAAEQYGFDMPQTIAVDVTVDPQAKVGLFNDGQDHLFLTIRSEANLRKPSDSGTFHIYGMCHEVGHLAMYRLLPDHSWMTADAAEGWAHYLGSLLVDAVYAEEGADLWPDRYDYRDDGMKRLRAQGVKAKGPVAWHKLKRIVGEKGIAPIFRAWGKTQFDPADPAASLGTALKAVSKEEETARWWDQSKDLLVLQRVKSAVAAETTEEKLVTGPCRQLAHDEGHAAGKASLAGGGHAVRFEAPDDSWYLTEVRIHGSRYGYPAPPKEDFQVWLCDQNFQQIAKFSYPYSKFQKGDSRWVVLKTKPTRVPKRFIVCVGFNPTATKGVFVSRDAQANGSSITGLPGQEAVSFDQGNWLIRVAVAQKNRTDSTSAE